ncbi:MAG: FG-GAP-like repeat-containing protein, partial [Candidatus Cloacimonadota bacterium]|nr:FG-GAP-like repeat-containing protein [Candidatus Cloacimonadota bacterium]
GFDIETGYGLINAGDLLNNENSSQIEISYPSDFSGESGTFEIIGTVKSELFSRYTVMYTDKENPTSADWSDVSSPHNNTPTFYFEQKENEKLAEFEISEIFTDGNYVVMVKMYLSDGTTYNDKIHISIDKTKPNLLFADYQKRYESSNSKHFFFTVFDDPVIASLVVEFNNEEHILSSSYVDSVHFFQLPISFSGAISITVNATNRAQLQMDEVSIDNIVIDDDFVSLSSYSATESGEAIIVTEKFIEETNSFFGYRDIAGSYAPIQRFQLSNNQISLVSTIQDTTGATIEGVPEDIGNTNSERIEFINLKSSVLNVYEAYELGNYDIFKSIFEIPECNGAVFGDYNGNNIDDIVACVDYDVNPTLTKKVLKLFSRSGSDFVLQYILYNNSETSFRNTFHPSTRIGDLDGDEFTDVLAVDQDGDAMIYELHTSANANEIQPDSLIWSKRLPVQNANLLEIGDFDGDGQNDFCVGGYYIDDYNYQNEYWCLSFYHTDGDNSFHLYDRLYFSNVQLLSRNNSINAADLNNDGTDELVCSFTPNAYIIDFDSENNEYTPLWAGLSGFSYRTLIKEASDETIAKIVMNTNQDNGSNVQIIQMSEEILLEPPHHFQAVPINQNEIELSWDFDEDADNYNIYRRNSDSEIVLFDTILDDSYIDDSVSINETYHYSISMIDNDFTPSESMQTNWISATPNIAPHLLNIKMNTANTIMLGYSFPLGNSAQEIGNYRLDNEYGVPTS